MNRGDVLFFKIHVCLTGISVFFSLLHPGRLELTHSPPHPTLLLGYAVSPRSALAPARRYAFTFSPYRNTSFPRTIPHSMSSAQLPATMGVAFRSQAYSPHKCPAR